MKKIAIVGPSIKDRQELLSIALENRFDIELVSFDYKEVKQKPYKKCTKETINIKDEMKQFIIHWLTGEDEKVTGHDIADAFCRAGYGGGVINAIDWYEEIK